MVKSKQDILPYQNYRFQDYENRIIEHHREILRKSPESIRTFPLKFNQHGHVPTECLGSKKSSLTNTFLSRSTC